MKTLRRCFLYSVSLLLFVVEFDAARLVFAQTQGARRVALVIGNSAYGGTSELKNPANDARSIATALQSAGFQVALAIDRTKRKIEVDLSRFAETARQAESAVFFFAGHGLQYNGTNFIMPIGARVSSPADLSERLVTVDDVLKALSATNGARILILDACRNNPLEDTQGSLVSSNQSRGFSRGLARIESSRAAGSFISFATQHNETALDGLGVNSPFTAALLRHLAMPGLELRQVFTRVRADVAAWTGNKQVPEVSDSLAREYVIKPANFGTSPSYVPATFSSIQRMVLKGYNGQTYAEVEVSRLPSGEWIERNVVSMEKINFRFVELSKTSTVLTLFDQSRNLIWEFDIVNRTTRWSIRNHNNWTRLFDIVETY